MSIYIAHIRDTSNALNTLILVEEKCLECPLECQLSAARILKLVWKQVSDSWSGD